VTGYEAAAYEREGRKGKQKGILAVFFHGGSVGLTAKIIKNPSPYHPIP
jgi:hypothetical protein